MHLSLDFNQFILEIKTHTDIRRSEAPNYTEETNTNNFIAQQNKDF